MTTRIAIALLIGTCAAQASTLIDLTTVDATVTSTGAIGGSFTVVQIPDQSTGTGVIDPFLRVQAEDTITVASKGKDKVIAGPFEQGFNTSISTPLDDKAGIWTHELLLSAIPIVDLNGTAYRQFMLDINQNSGGDNELLSLNQIQLFQLNGDRDTYSVTDPATGSAPVITFAGTPTTTEVFRLNNGGDANFKEILLDYSLNSGSGSGDMFFYVLDSIFDAGKTNVILYSQFGKTPGASGTNDGFEEWATILANGTPPPPPPPSIPEPASLVLLGTALIGAAVVHRKRTKASAA